MLTTTDLPVFELFARGSCSGEEPWDDGRAGAFRLGGDMSEVDVGELEFSRFRTIGSVQRGGCAPLEWRPEEKYGEG